MGRVPATERYGTLRIGIEDDKTRHLHPSDRAGRLVAYQVLGLLEVRKRLERVQRSWASE